MQELVILVVVIVVVVKFIIECAEESRTMHDVDRIIQKNVRDSDNYFKKEYGEDFGKKKH